jgi:hypothetical protein
MKVKQILIFIFFICLSINHFSVFSQQNQETPLRHELITSYDAMVKQIYDLDKSSDLLSATSIGTSVEGRAIYALNFSDSEFGKSQSKIKVLIIAQQHGNEQSGKEGSLLLAEWLLKPENRYLFEKIDLTLLPQLNPDGSEINQRRNANKTDLNRNHLILTEPETQALHRLFDLNNFEVTLDVHEYSPYGSSWKEYGYRKNTDVAIGTCTNSNISKKIRDLSNEKALPYILNHLAEGNFSSFVYCPGGPPEKDYIRHSTFDINDGRQSFGIQNTFSFIQEGMNGQDNFVENITHRASGQKSGMIALLEFVYKNKREIKKAVKQGREKLLSPSNNERIAIQSEHISNGQALQLPLFSYFTESDTIVIVKDYRPVVASITDVIKPLGYLIPKNNTELIEWVGRHQFLTENFEMKSNLKIEQYSILQIDSIDFERDIIVDPVVSSDVLKSEINYADYIYLPCNQLKGNMLVIGLEPKSMLGLVTYKQFDSLLKSGKEYPVLRVVKK